MGSRGRITALAADPRTDSVLFLASPGGGAWKTQDGGETWFPLADSAPTLQAYSLALDRRSPDVLYLGTGDDQAPRPAQGVARSADGGRTWTFLARFTNYPVRALAVDPADSRRLLAGSAEGLFSSTDTGATWGRVYSASVTAIAFDGTGNIYVGTIGEEIADVRENMARTNVLARSSDGGRTWTKLSLPPNPDGVQTNWVGVMAEAALVSVVVSYQTSLLTPGSAPTAQASLSRLDYCGSADSGNTWSAAIGIGRALPPVSLIADRFADRLYVAGNTLLTSANRGNTWQTIPTASGGYHTVAFTGGMLLLGGEKGLEPAAPMPDIPTRAISQPPLGQFLGASFDSSNGIWGAGPAGLFSPDPYYDPVLGSRVPGIGAIGRVVAVTSGSTIYAAGPGAVYRSTDGGLNFSSRTILPDSELRAPFPPLIVDPVNPASAYVAGRRLYRTTDSGATWAALVQVSPDPTHVVIALASAPASRLVLFASTACLPEVAMVSCPAKSQIWRSLNGGQSWTRMATVAGLVSQMAVDPRLNNTVYAAVGAFPGGPSISAGSIPGDLLQSADGGTTWTSVRGNLPHVPVNAVVVDPSSLPSQLTQPARTLYVGTDAGVFASFDAGLQWTDLRGSANYILPASPITHLSLLRPDGLLVATTFGRGIYRTATAGLGARIIIDPLSVDMVLAQGATANAGIGLTNASLGTPYGWRLNALDPWISIPEPSGTVKPGGSQQVAIRISAADLRPGIYRGRLQLVSGTSLQNIIVQAHVTASPAQITIVSGNNAVGAAGTSLPPLQVLVSDADQRPLSGIAINFAITSGGGSLSARAVLTNAAGIAGAVLTLPANRATVQVTASCGERSVTFTATSVVTPTLQSDSVSDGVTFNSYASFGPGSILSISGQGLAEGTLAADGASLPPVLKTTRVLLSSSEGDLSLPLFSVSPTRIKALVPAGVLPGTYKLRVEVASIRSKDLQISVGAFSPGIFTLNESGRGQGVFIKKDGSLVTSANPADRGTTVSFYAAGLGAVTPPVQPGQPGAVEEPMNRTVGTPRVFFDSYAAEVIYSGLAPGISGRYLITVRVPALVSRATNISVSLTIGGIAGNRVTIPVR